MIIPIKVIFEEKDQLFPIRFEESDDEFKIEFQESGGGAAVPYYDGKYEVIPKFGEQILETKSKQLRENVVVTEIPIEYIEDVGGGITAIIGG